MSWKSIWAVLAGALVVGQRKRSIRRRKRLELAKLVGKVDYDRRYSYKRERRPARRMKLTARAALGLLLSAGCAARQAPPIAVAAPTREGVTSMRVLPTDAPTAPPSDEDVERITPAFASDQNKLPVYPPHALEAGCQDGVVPIRAYIGTDGNVASIRSIPARPVADDSCHAAFSAATYATVLGWRFSPAFRQTPKPGRDVDGDGRPDLTRWEQTPIVIYLDFEFTFRVVEGKGTVQTR